MLQSQNEAWLKAHRNEARRELNAAYDRFAFTYGPINKTTFGETADGHVIRRMPNLVKFREDPDAMLVMSLEDYDEITGKGAKAAIMNKDVVGKTPLDHRMSGAPEEGLLVSTSTNVARWTLPLLPHSTASPKKHVVVRRLETSTSSTTRSRRPGRPPTPISPATLRRSSPAAESAGRRLCTTQRETLPPRSAGGCFAR